MVVSLGDLHFSDNRPWSFEVSKEVVKHIINSPENNPSNTLVLLGDLTEAAMLSGQMYELLLDLFVGLRYNNTYVIVGNHDRKANRQGKLVLAYKFLQDPKKKKLFTSNIKVIDTVEEISIEDNKCLFLPYIFSDSGYDWKYYESLPDDIKNTHYDIIFGHYTDSSNISFKDRIVDTSYLKTKYWCIGHQHLPGGNYLGSVIPNSTSEANHKRYQRHYFKVGKDTEYSNLELPVFSDYYSITYPDSLPVVPAKFPVWTIHNCASEEIAKEQYGNLYIQKCIYQSTIDISELKDLGVFSGSEVFTTQRLFDLFIGTVSFEDKEIERLTKGYLATV